MSSPFGRRGKESSEQVARRGGSLCIKSRGKRGGVSEEEVVGGGGYRRREDVCGGGGWVLNIFCRGQYSHQAFLKGIALKIAGGRMLLSVNSPALLL